MTDKMDRLLQTLSFLRSHRDSLSDDGSATHIRAIDTDVDAQVQRVLQFDPTDLQSAIRKTSFIIGEVCDRAADQAKANALRKICERHLSRLQLQLREQVERRTLPTEIQCLESLEERVSFFGLDYRYIYTNAANCEFHRERAAHFVGRPNWTIVGDQFFEQINKTRFDACFAGHRMSYYNVHPSAVGRVFSVTFDPAFDTRGRVLGALVTSRDVSLLPVPKSLILGCSDERAG